MKTTSSGKGFKKAAATANKYVQRIIITDLRRKRASNQLEEETKKMVWIFCRLISIGRKTERNTRFDGKRKE